MDSQEAVALSARTIHLDPVPADLFELSYSDICTREVGQHRRRRKDELYRQSRSGSVLARLTPNPTLVAIDELQLQLLHIALAAVPPMKIIQPEQIELPRAPTPPVSSGIDNNAPMVDGMDVQTLMSRGMASKVATA